MQASHLTEFNAISLYETTSSSLSEILIFAFFEFSRQCVFMVGDWGMFRRIDHFSTSGLWWLSILLCEQPLLYTFIVGTLRVLDSSLNIDTSLWWVYPKRRAWALALERMHTNSFISFTEYNYDCHWSLWHGVSFLAIEWSSPAINWLLVMLICWIWYSFGSFSIMHTLFIWFTCLCFMI